MLYHLSERGSHSGEGRALHISRKFESFLERYRREDGRRWSGQDLHDATGGVVTRSYVSTLRRGRIENPGFEKLRAIARAMGFPPELWFEEVGEPGPAVLEGREGGSSLSERVERLFQVVRNERTGEPYTEAEVARAALGDLTEEDVRGIRSGSLADPTMSQVAALAEFFRVDPAYFLGAGGGAALLDEESLRALGDERSRSLLHKSLDLTGAEKDLLLDMIEHLARLREDG